MWNDGRFDTVAAEAVIEARTHYPEIRLIAVIPSIWFYRKFTTQSYERYTILLENSDQIVTFPKMESRLIFFYRNQFLLENAMQLICHYNGKNVKQCN